MGILGVLVLLLVVACGPPKTTCDLVLKKELPSFSGKCPPNTILTGVQGNQLTCTEVSVACPKE